MKKCVLDIGNCGPDHNAIRSMLQSNFDAEVLQADATADAIEILQSKRVDLILVNRKLDVDYTDGIDVLTAIKADARFSEIPAMLVTNMDDYQQDAVQKGAEYGFGKLALRNPETQERLRKFLA